MISHRKQQMVDALTDPPLLDEGSWHKEHVKACMAGIGGGCMGSFLCVWMNCPPCIDQTMGYHQILQCLAPNHPTPTSLYVCTEDVPLLHHAVEIASHKEACCRSSPRQECCGQGPCLLEEGGSLSCHAWGIGGDNSNPLSCWSPFHPYDPSVPRCKRGCWYFLPPAHPIPKSMMDENRDSPGSLILTMCPIARASQALPPPASIAGPHHRWQCVSPVRE